MDWETVKTKFPWQLIFLYGGGYAMADACEVGLDQLCLVQKNRNSNHYKSYSYYYLLIYNK